MDIYHFRVTTSSDVFPLSAVVSPVSPAASDSVPAFSVAGSDDAAGALPLPQPASREAARRTERPVLISFFIFILISSIFI